MEMHGLKLKKEERTFFSYETVLEKKNHQKFIMAL